jgi:hypothetical protein
MEAEEKEAETKQRRRADPEKRGRRDGALVIHPQDERRFAC